MKPRSLSASALAAELQAQRAAARSSAAARLTALRASLSLPRAPALPTLPTLPKLPTLPTLPPSVQDQMQQLRRQRARRASLRVALLLAFLALLLLFFRDCACDPPPMEPERVEEPALVCPPTPECGPAKKRPAKPTKRKSTAAQLPPQDRDRLSVPQTTNPPWLAELRLQVSARSVDLAVCFNGVEKPGALRWSTTVSPGPGTVSDSVLEPVLQGPPLTNEQKACVLGALAARPYRLTPDGEDDWGSRVSLVLEF